MRETLKLAAILLLAGSVGCDRGPRSGTGLRLPDGDIERGKAAFLQLRCHACHTVAGMDLPPPEKAYAYIRPVVLGGEVLKVQTYGQLVTSIINPSHTLAKGYPPEVVQRNGQSQMANLNDGMTVSQLIDLVAFLQSRYKLVPPETGFAGP